MWRWSNFLHRHAWCSQPPLLINMDETAIRLHQTWRPGLLSTTARNMMRQPRGIVRNASRSERRTMFTLLAFVCNDEDIQEVLRRVASTSCFKYFNVMTRCFELRTYSVYSEPLQQCVLLAFFRDPRRPLKEKPQAHFISSRPPLESGLFFASVFWPQNRGHKKRSNTM